MKTQRALSDEQERLRLEGLRALARIIARRALADSRAHVISRKRTQADETQHRRVRDQRA